MPTRDFPRIITVVEPQGLTRKWSTLTKMAICYHQDFVFLKEDVYEIAQSYFRGLSESEKIKLKAEILEFTSNDKNSKALLEDWYNKGAGAWDRKVDLRTFFEKVLEIFV